MLCPSGRHTVHARGQTVECPGRRVAGIRKAKMDIILKAETREGCKSALGKECTTVVQDKHVVCRIDHAGEVEDKRIVVNVVAVDSRSAIEGAWRGRGKLYADGSEFTWR